MQLNELKTLSGVPHVDYWKPQPFNFNYENILDQDTIFLSVNGNKQMFVPLTYVVNVEDANEEYHKRNPLNYFTMNTKRSYMNNLPHIVKYLSHFNKFYDIEKKYISGLFKIKYLLDSGNMMDINTFVENIYRYILTPEIRYIVSQMVKDNNTRVELSKYENKNNPALEYTSYHIDIFLQVSICQILVIPLITHYFYMINPKMDKESFIVDITRSIMNLFLPEVDLLNKLLETVDSMIDKSMRDNKILWEKQDIRGITRTNMIAKCLRNLLTNIIQKYRFNDSIVNMHIGTVETTIGYTVTNVSFEYEYIPIATGGGGGDDDSASSNFDKVEAFQIKQSELLFLYNNVNCEKSMEIIDKNFGPFSEEEIKYYRERLTENNSDIVLHFQKKLVSYLFYQVFVEPTSLDSINSTDYIKLLIAAKRYLESKGLYTIANIISGKHKTTNERKSLSKREEQLILTHANYPLLIYKYGDPSIINRVLEIIATILASDFEVISMDQSIDRLPIKFDTNTIINEVLFFILMI